MKKSFSLLAALSALILFSSCSPVVYSHTENDITIRGTRADRHHVETISLPKTLSL
jgi:hypothetical protein